MTKRIGTAVLLTYADQVLLLYHKQRGWELPGGKVEPNEDIQRAAARELNEETGLYVKSYNFEHCFYVENKEWVTLVFKTDFTNIVGSTVMPHHVALKLEETHGSYQWVSYRELLKMYFKDMLSVPMESIVEYYLKQSPWS